MKKVEERLVQSAGGDAEVHSVEGGDGSGWTPSVHEEIQVVLIAPTV